jgi:hypothetical protein
MDEATDTVGEAYQNQSQGQDQPVSNQLYSLPAIAYGLVAGLDLRVMTALTF